MAYKKATSNIISSESELILSNDYYLHKTIVKAIESPFKALESNTFEDGLKAVQLAGFLSEKLAWSGKKFTEGEETDLNAHLEKEKDKLLKEGISKDSQTFKSMLAYAKIAWILRFIVDAEPTVSEYKL